MMLMMGLSGSEHVTKWGVAGEHPLPGPIWTEGTATVSLDSAVRLRAGGSCFQGRGLWPRAAGSIPEGRSSCQPEPNSDGEHDLFPIISAELGDQAFSSGESTDVHVHAALHKSRTHLHSFVCFTGCEV